MLEDDSGPGDDSEAEEKWLPYQDDYEVEFIGFGNWLEEERKDIERRIMSYFGFLQKQTSRLGFKNK